MAKKQFFPSASDVAEKAGVSRTQVSYVLNNTRIEHVSPVNQRKILEAARDLGYYPQQSGRALRKGFVNEFALFFPAPYTFRINAMLGTIHEQGLADRCVPVQFSFNSYADPGRKKEALRVLAATRPRGLFCSLFDVDEEDLREARDRGIPNIVVYDAQMHVEHLTLRIPFEEAGFLAVSHLIDKGHRRIGFLRPSDPVAQRGYLPRWRGGLRAVQGTPGAELIELPWSRNEVRPTLPFAREFVDTHGLGTSGVTAVYAYSDEYALPLLTVLLDRGIRVPDRLAVLGTDDLPFGQMVRPSLSTIRLDQEDLGNRAVQLINTSLTGQPLAGGDTAPLRPTLVPRGTT